MKSSSDPIDLKHNRFIGQVQFTFMLVLIFVVSYLLFKSGEEQTTLTFMQWYMGVFMLTFAAIKLLDYKMFAFAFSTFDIVAKRIKLYAYAYPFILLGLAVMHLNDVLPYVRNILTLSVAVVAIIGVFQDVFIKRNQQSCGILGRIIKLPYTTIGLIECIALIIMSILSLLLAIS
jgi:hypothetical protein